MISDYYSVSYLPIESDGYIEELNIISRIYRSHGVDKIYLAREFTPSVTASSYLSRSAHYFTSARKSLCTGVKLIPIHTVTVTEGISESDLGLLAYKTPNGSFLYVKVPIGISRDTLAYELHNIIYKHKLTPVFVSIEAVAHFSSERVFDVILSVPNALYLFSLPNINSPDSRELISKLIAGGKRFIFGSGEGFDACPYKNIDYYIKNIKRALGKDTYGYYLLRHNRIFK